MTPVKAIPQTITPMSGVVTATTGATSFYDPRFTIRGARYWVTTAASAAAAGGMTSGTVAIQGSPGGSTWVAIATVTNPGIATSTGAFDGPFKYFRVVTTGADNAHGTVTVKLMAICLV